MLLRRCLVLLISVIFSTANRGFEKGCWPLNIIPYKIEKGFTQAQTHHILQQIDQLHRLTCVRWVDLVEESLNVTEYALFVKTEEKTCHMQGSRSRGVYVARVTLADVCFTRSGVIHEMLHVMGFDHEHKRSDRNCYVDVDQNAVIRTGQQDQYEIEPQEEWLERFPYDKLSVMHYFRDSRLKPKYERRYTYEPLGNTKGELTYVDLWKIWYRFCNAPHYCDVVPLICEFIDKVEKECREPRKSYRQISSSMKKAQNPENDKLNKCY